MASFRRITSTVQRDGAVLNGETIPVSSISQKLLHTQNHSPSTLFRPPDLVTNLHKIRDGMIGICSARSPRPLERSKSKGQLWKRAFFHFCTCFMIGAFISLTPFVSVEYYVNHGSKNPTFSFEVFPPRSTMQRQFAVVRNVDFKRNVTFEEEMKQDSRNDSSSDALIVPSPIQEFDLVYQKLLIVVTPTYPRPFQAYYMNRLAHTLRLVPPPLLWIVVEMSSQSDETAELLRKNGVIHRHLVCDANVSNIRYRAVHLRNVALSHIEKHRLDGIVHFADDYNMYSVDLFEQMRAVRRFGVWPLAMLTESKNKAILEGPVCNKSQVIGWHTNLSRRFRRFHVGMSGFAFNSTILWDHKRWRRPTPEPIRQLDKIREGLQVSSFIEQMVEDESQMEGLPEDCSRIMVWHLHLEAPSLLYPRGWLMQKNLDSVAPLM